MSQSRATKLFRSTEEISSDTLHWEGSGVRVDLREQWEVQDGKAVLHTKPSTL